MAKTPIKELLFGRLATAGRFITEEQIAECVELQERYRAKGGPAPRLGEILAMKGYMSPDQVRAVLDGQHNRREGLFGEIAVRWRFAERESLEKALELQREMDAAGKHRSRIGEILVGRGELQPHQVRAILDAQGKRIVHCSGCSARFNVAHFRGGARVKCPKCGATTVMGEGERHVTDESPLDVVNTIWLSKEEEERTAGLGEESDTAAQRALEIGGYEMLSRLGSDATGVICKARHLATDNMVALKIMRPDPQLGKDFLERFVEETRQAVLLDHPGLKRIYEVGSDRGRYFLAEEFIEGKSLKRQLEQVGKLTPSEAIDVADQIAEALEYGHRKGIVHGDARPSNVILDQTGRARLAGLGVAKDAALNLRYFGRDASNVPFYLAPEQAVDAARTDARSDIYSLGAMLYHMVTARPPYAGQGSLEVLMRLTQEPLISPRQIVPELSKELSALITEMLAAEPDERPQTIAEVRSKLRLAGGTLRVQGAASARPATASTERVPTPSEPVKPVVRDRLAAEAFGERRYARERFTGRRKSSSGTPVVIGVVVAVLALLGLGGYLLAQASKNEETGRRKPPPRRSRDPLAIPKEPAEPDYRLFAEAARYAENNIGDDDEIRKRFKAVLDRYPGSEYADQARQRYAKHLKLSARRTLGAIKRDRPKTEDKGDFLTSMTAVDGWLSKYAAANDGPAKGVLDDLLKQGRDLKGNVNQARTGFIARKTLEIDKLIEARDFTGARGLLDVLSKLVSEKGAGLIAEKTRKLEDAAKAHKEAERLARLEAERLAREDLERRKKEAVRRALAEKFEKFRMGIAKLTAERQLEKALGEVAVARAEFGATVHETKRARMEEGLQLYAVFYKGLTGGVRTAKGKPTLEFAKKRYPVVEIKGQKISLDLGIKGKMILPWRAFAAADLAALGGIYVDEKDGSSRLGCAIFCAMVGSQKAAAEQLAAATKLGTKTEGVKAVLDGKLLLPSDLPTDEPGPEKPVKTPKDPGKEPVKPKVEKPRVNAGPGSLILDVTRDARITCRPSEATLNSGKSERLRTRSILKSSAEIVILDFDGDKLKAFLEKRPDRKIQGQLILQVREVQGGPAKVEVASLESSVDWGEGDKSQKAAAKGESCYLAAQKDVEPWTTPAGKKVANLKELFYDSDKKAVTALLNSKSVEVSKDQKAVVIELDEKLVRRLGSDVFCRGLLLFNRHADAKVDFYSRERKDMAAKLVVVAGGLRPTGVEEEPGKPKLPDPKEKKPAPLALAAPTEFTVEAVSPSEVKLTWKDSSKDETGFEVQRCERTTDAFKTVLTAYNGKARRPAIVPGGFREGSAVTIGGRDRWRYVPSVLKGRTSLITSPKDRSKEPIDKKYVLKFSAKCTIYLPMKSLTGGARPPSLDASWKSSGLKCKSVLHEDWTVWQKTAAAGSVSLPCHRDWRGGYGFTYVFAGAVEKHWKFVVSREKNVTGYQDQGLKRDTRYYYRVRALGLRGATSKFTSEILVTTPATRTAPGD